MFVVVVVWFCCSSWLALLILTYYSNLMHQFSLHWGICFGGYLIVHTEFFEKDLDFLGFAKNIFWVFLSVPHLVDNYAKIVDGRGRNLMCHRTLPSRLVSCIVAIFDWFFKRSATWACALASFSLYSSSNCSVVLACSSAISSSMHIRSLSNTWQATILIEIILQFSILKSTIIRYFFPITFRKDFISRRVKLNNIFPHR